MQHFKCLILAIFLVCNLLVIDKSYAEGNHDRKRLSKAIKEGDFDKVKSLIESNKIDIDEPSDDHGSPLVEAAYETRLEIMKYLIKKGAFIEGISKDGRTPLTEVIKAGGKKKLANDRLLKRVLFLIDSGADVNFPGEEGYTPLMCACKYTQNIELVQMLIDKGALIDAQAKDEKNPIILALLNGHSKAFRLLLDSGASLFITVKGLTPLGVLAEAGTPEMAKLLIKEVNVDVNEYDRFGVTPIFWAASANNGSMIKFLVKNGADINATNISQTNVKTKNDPNSLIISWKKVIFPIGCTPLTFAKKFDSTEAIKIIKELGGQEFQEVEIKEESLFPF